jgi:FKBP-type peptidyl-prolyl cis-trans isomerase 2
MTLRAFSSSCFSFVQGNVVPALDAALAGMQAGGRRRVNVRPERGWKLPDQSCLKTYTDITVVPGTQVAVSSYAALLC